MSTLTVILLIALLILLLSLDLLSEWIGLKAGKEKAAATVAQRTADDAVAAAKLAKENQEPLKQTDSAVLDKLKDGTF